MDVGAGQIAWMFAAEAWREPQNARGGAVFAGRAREVVETVDHGPDRGHPPAGLCYLDVHIHDLDDGHTALAEERRALAELGDEVLPHPGWR